MPQLMQTSEGKFLNEFGYDLEELKECIYIDKYNGLYRIKILYTIYIPNSSILTNLEKSLQMNLESIQ